MSYAHRRFDSFDNVIILERSAQLAGPNQTLGATVSLAFDHAQKLGNPFRYVMTAALEYPFVHEDILDDAVNTVELFKSDSVLSVRPDNKMYYRHNGQTLSPILDQEQFTRLEREALYRAVGGIMVSTKANFEQRGKINSGTMSHVVVDEKSAFGIHTEFDFQVYCALLENEKTVINQDKG